MKRTSAIPALLAAAILLLSGCAPKPRLTVGKVTESTAGTTASETTEATPQTNEPTETVPETKTPDSDIVLALYTSASIRVSGVDESTKLVFLSSDPTVVTVSDSGTVYALHVGSAVVTIKEENGPRTSLCRVTVVDVLPPETETSAVPSDGTPTVTTPTETPVTPTDTPVTQTETPIAPTDTPVTPSDTPVTPTETPIETIPMEGIELIGTTDQFAGNSYRYTVKPFPADSNEKCLFRSSNPDVCSIDENGVATAKMRGSARITVLTEDERLSHSIYVTVHNQVRDLSLVQYCDVMEVGKTYDFVCAILPEGYPNLGVYWVDEYKNGAVSLDPDGLCTCRVTALKAGEVCITVGSNDFDSMTHTYYFTVKEGT